MPAEHTPFGECCAGGTPAPGERLVEFDNIYEDGTRITARHIVRILSPEAFTALTAAGVEALTEDGVTIASYEEYQRELLWCWTGTGKCEGDAGYFAKSVDGLEPVINEEWC